MNYDKLVEALQYCGVEDVKQGLYVIRQVDDSMEVEAGLVVADNVVFVGGYHWTAYKMSLFEERDGMFVYRVESSRCLGDSDAYMVAAQYIEGIPWR